MKYTVNADNLSGYDRGDTVTDEDFSPNVNVAALVASGHLTPTPTSKPAPKKD
jgi:hypothetical protein